MCAQALFFRPFEWPLSMVYWPWKTSCAYPGINCLLMMIVGQLTSSLFPSPTPTLRPTRTSWGAQLLFSGELHCTQALFVNSIWLILYWVQCLLLWHGDLRTWHWRFGNTAKSEYAQDTTQKCEYPRYQYFWLAHEAKTILWGWALKPVEPDTSSG